MIDAHRPAPWFVAPSPVNPTFAFSSLAGCYLLMGFLPNDPVRADAMVTAAARLNAQFDGIRLRLVMVTRDPARFARAKNHSAVFWFLDGDAQISRAYGALGADDVEAGGWVVVDPAMRIFSTWNGAQQDGPMIEAVATLPAVDDYAGVELNAPVLVVPRIFEPELCQTLIDLYERQGGMPSGVMRDIGGRTVPVMTEQKRRRDAAIHDEALKTLLRRRVEARLLPEITKAFHWRATRIERYIVACYDAEEGGWFNAHRDNTTAATAHRRFACSINLNADFDGGELRFPEFGSRTYRPPPGGAVVFSCNLLHQATPVTRGIRYAFLPFFHDESGEALRLKNLHLLDESVQASAPQPVPAT